MTSCEQFLPEHHIYLTVNSAEYQQYQEASVDEEVEDTAEGEQEEQ